MEIVIDSGTLLRGKCVVTKATLKNLLKNIITGNFVFESCARYSVCPEKLVPHLLIESLLTGAVTNDSAFPCSINSTALSIHSF